PTTAITYLFYRPDVGFGRQTGLAAEYAGRYASDPEDHLVGVTGTIPGRVAQLVILRETLEKVEVATVILILLVVALNFRAVGAPLVTMATAGVALAVIVRLAGLIGEKFGIDIPSEIEPVMVALLLGIVTDYSIFFLSGMRERLVAGDDRVEAARSSTEEFAPIVLVAGLTVAAGSLALLVARVGLFRTFGPGMAFTILISLVVAVTLVPACLAILGRWVFWPHVPRPQPATAPPPRSRFVEAITRKRNGVLVAVVGAGVLLVAAAPVRDLDLGFVVTDSLPADLEARRAADAAGEGFAPGILSPTVLLIEGADVGDRPAALDRLQGLLERQPGVAFVAGPANQPARISIGAVVSTSGDAARYVVVFDASPLSATTIGNLDRLDQAMPALLAEAGIPDVRTSFAGDTALAASTVIQTKADLGRVVLVATALGFVLLVLFLRAIVASLYLMAVNLLAVTAALGVTTFVFQSVAGTSGLTFYVPFAAAVLLVALGADYSIFGVGYIWAEARHRPLWGAIRVAVPRSTRAISAAGITLALSFAMLAFVPLRPFREFALAMAVGILLDVFVVRSLLVPSLISVVGQTSGWPGRALRRVPPTTPRPAPTPSPRRRRKAASLTWMAGALVVYLLDRKRSRRPER
ncbi:MAG: MMPL family transporter, partial [Actinomycetota bacterium]|nr:MMPL family transporter [Actinomycetota bacterium]